MSMTVPLTNRTEQPLWRIDMCTCRSLRARLYCDVMCVDYVCEFACAYSCPWQTTRKRCKGALRFRMLTESASAPDLR